MEKKGLTCRHCGRPIAVPASKCPWCGRTIMVICSACKQYTDDQQKTCQHCGAELVPDRLEKVRETLELHPEVARMVEDRQRAKLVASGVVARYPCGFFFDDGRRKTVLVELFGSSPEPQRTAAALLFSAIAYLTQEGYCSLDPLPDEEEGFYWNERRRWDGQVRSLEGALARQAGLGATVRKVIDRVVADEMGFRFEVNRPPLIRAPGMSSPPRVINLSARPATMAVIEAGRLVELPDHRENEACRETYRRLVAFVQADPARSRYLADQILEILDWFRRFEENPSLALMR